MRTITYKIEFFNYWHVGSGLSGSTYADSMVNKDADNLPFVPGKTIKGLLRDAAEQIKEIDSSLVSDDFINKVFGVIPEKSAMIAVENEGGAFFTNAGLSEELTAQIIEKKLTAELYNVLSSTAIDENGQAINTSLRQMEVTVPLVLYGLIENYPVETTIGIEACMGWIKRLGKNRNRGFGSCQFTILKD